MEILFRGKDAESGKWLYGWVFGEKAKSIIELDTQYVSKDGVEAYCTSVVIQETVGQYTGIDDRNGVKIFDGDIVKYHPEANAGIGRVEYLGSGFYVGDEFNGLLDDFATMGIEVIGNIHDNSELLDG